MNSANCALSYQPPRPTHGAGRIALGGLLVALIHAAMQAQSLDSDGVPNIGELNG